MHTKNINTLFGFTRLPFLTKIQKDILNVLIDKPLHRDQICEALGFSFEIKFLRRRIRRFKNLQAFIYTDVIEKVYEKRTTVYDNLVKLQKQKLVIKFESNNGKRGRNHVYWKINY